MSTELNVSGSRSFCVTSNDTPAHGEAVHLSTMCAASLTSSSVAVGGTLTVTVIRPEVEVIAGEGTPSSTSRYLSVARQRTPQLCVPVPSPFAQVVVLGVQKPAAGVKVSSPYVALAGSRSTSQLPAVVV